MRFITPKNHGILDYLLVVFLLASPKLLEMEPKATNFTYALAIAYFILAVATDYKPGIARVLPFSMHGVIDLVLGVGLIIWGYSYFNTDPFAHVYYVWLGGAMLVMWLFTNYEKPKVKTPRRALS